eukprot:1516381-Pyramimonas_sp.AAC.1
MALLGGSLLQLGCPIGCCPERARGAPSQGRLRADSSVPGGVAEPAEACQVLEALAHRLTARRSPVEPSPWAPQ